MGGKRRSRREILRTAYRHLQHASEIIQTEYGNDITPAVTTIVSTLRNIMLDLEDEMDTILKIQEWYPYDPKESPLDNPNKDRERTIAKKAEEVCTKYGQHVMFVCPNCGGDAVGVKKHGGAIAVECENAV